MNHISSKKRKLHILVALILFVAALWTSACGTSSENTSENQTSSPSTEPDKQEKVPIKMALAVKTLSFAPLFVADTRGYFEDEGIDLEIISVEGSGGVVQALSGNSVQFGASDSGSITQPNDKGVGFYAIETVLNKLSMDLTIHSSIAEELDIDRSKPIEERFAALKGKTLGITSPGAATDIFTRYYLKQAGLNPQVDAKIISIGTAPSLAAALKNQSIDAFMIAPPTPQITEQEGYGKIIISASQDDVEELKNFVYEVILAKKEYVEANPEITKKVARAIARGNNLIRNNPAEAFKELQKTFDNIDPEILELSVEALSPAVPIDGKADQAGWQTTVNIHRESEMIKNDLDTSEGVMWTNEFVQDVNGQDD